MFLCVYLLLFSIKLKNSKLLIKIGGTVISIMALSYCMFSMFYLSSVNAKGSDVQDVYRSMHPILRVGTADHLHVELRE